MKANLQTTEPAAIARWNKMGLYARIRERRAGAPHFTLHDGPPYANGRIHIGHVLNKVLKDIIVKSRTMAGFDAPYVPGWDCHGLPIELKVDKELGRRKRDMSVADFRRACRAVRGEVRRAAVGRFPAVGRPRRLGPAVSDDDQRLSGRDRAGLGLFRRAGGGSTSARSRCTGVCTAAQRSPRRKWSTKTTPRRRSTSSFR